MKIKHLLTKTLLVAAGLCVGANAWGTEVKLDPVGVFTWTNTPAITYNADATSWAINQGGISGGKIGRYAGPYAIVKFDASEILSGMTLLSATLDFDIVAGGYNSSINIALLSDASFTPSTVTTDNFVTTATQFQAGDWSTKNTTTSFSYSVKDYVDANNVLAFAIYTNTGREQTLKNVKLTINYSAEAVAKYNYSLKAVDSESAELAELASGEEYEGSSVTAYFPYMFTKSSTLYKTTESPYSVTFDKDNTSAQVTYTTAPEEIVAYMEGESVNATSGENKAYSNGKCGYVAGGKTQNLATLQPGKYTATIYLVANGNRALVIRNSAVADVTTNTIISLPISKTSAAGVYTSDEFTITEETTIGFSGYTSDTKTNQSADIDYIYVTKTGEASVTATVGSRGYATFNSDYALDLTGTDYAYQVTGVSGSTVTLEAVTKAVAANTPLILVGAGDKEIPVAASGDDISATNLLVAVTADNTTVAKAASGTNYVLAYQNEAVVFAPVNAYTPTLNKGQAYLAIPGAGAPQFNLQLEQGTTGISDVRSKTEDVRGDFFDLSGRRVAQPTKGLYIVNGKKVVLVP